MGLYFYCPKQSSSAAELSNALGATRLRRFDGIDFWNKGNRIILDPGSHLVCWGTPLPSFEEIKVLNSREKVMNKLQDHEALAKVVPTITVLPIDPNYSTKRYLESGYIPRSFRESLIYWSTEVADYYTLKRVFTTEYRIHSFSGRSIRAGIKVPIDGLSLVTELGWKPNSNLVHPWIKTHAGGWRTNYEGSHGTTGLRTTAHRAVRALGLTFGAVDIGIDSNGHSCVIGVDTAPVIEGKTITAYVRAIHRWVRDEVKS